MKAHSTLKLQEKLQKESGGEGGSQYLNDKSITKSTIRTATMPRASPLTLAGRSQHGHRQPTATALAKAVVAAAPMAAPPHAQVDIEAAAPGRRCRRCAVAAPPLPAAVASVRI